MNEAYGKNTDPWVYMWESRSERGAGSRAGQTEKDNMIQGNATSRMVLEVEEPLLAALASLSAHSSRILSSWRKLLKDYKVCAKYAASLSGLRVGPQLRDLIFADPLGYREKSERQGQDLARSGVPAECVAVAIALYVESCLPYLVSEESAEGDWTRAFARWASIYQFFLLTGYVQHAAVERRALEERIRQAERRSQDFSVQLGEAYEKERRHLAQDLHDEIGHDLIS
jgi:signal transduction histidine kinase